MVTFSHPIGNANVRAAAMGFIEARILTEFKTSIACFPGDILDRLGTIEAFSEIRRRRYDSALKTYTQTWPWFEVGRLLSLKTGLSSLIEHEKGTFSVDQVYRKFDKHVADNLKQSVKKGTKIVYAYEDGAEFSFREAKHLGLKCFYDLPIGYWRAAKNYLEKEQNRWPDWSSTLTGFLDSEAKLLRKDQELILSDKIFVASTFTAKTLLKFPGKLSEIEVIPYGFPPVTNSRTYLPAQNRKLKLLFVGGLSQRKGIANIFAAVEYFKANVELTIVGSKMNENCNPLNVELKKHIYIPSLPHQEILELMRKHDVLVFPSLFEGFGLVISEAMSQGTPVITTNRTAGADFIKHGENGWLVEAGSTEALCSTLESLIVKPERIAEVGRNAMKTALLRPWGVYGQELAEVIALS